MSASKTCQDCGEDYPLSKDHWRRKKSGEWDVRCLQCRARTNRGKRLKRKTADMQSIERGAANEFMKAVSRGGSNIPHSSELLERLMEYFGGTSGFSALLVKQYFDSVPGGAARTKMLDAIVRLVTRNTDMGGAKKPLGQWTEEELEAELDGRLRSLAAQFQGRIVDGTLAQEAGGPAAAAVCIEDGRVPGRTAKRAAGRARRAKDRSPADVPADTSSGRDARLQGQ